MKSVRLAAIAGLCLPLLSCYEEPVRDHLHIVFTPGPAIVATAIREIAPPAAAGENAAVEERTDEARIDLAGGMDRWSRSFSDLDAIADRSTIVRHDGDVRRGIHSALLDSFRPIERLLGTEGLSAYFDEDGRIRELQLRPTGGSQATRKERETFEDDLVPWTENVAAYLRATTTLYAYFDQTPDRAVPCFAHIFDEHPEGSGPLSDEEEGMVLRINKSMERVAEALLIDSGQAYSLNELSRLIYDTFQGRLTVTVDGPILDIEGFVEEPTFVERPPVDLWRALEVVSGRWLAPDLVTTFVIPAPENAQPEVDPVAFANLPRRWAPAPDAHDVESALRAQLRPEELYLVRWQTQPAPENEDEVYELAIEQLTTAEQDLPE